MVDLDQAWEQVADQMDDPDSWERPDRFRGGTKVGPIKNDPGYRGRVRTRITKRGLEVLCDRPYLPKPSQQLVTDTITILGEHILGAIPPPGGGRGQ